MNEGYDKPAIMTKQALGLSKIPVHPTELFGQITTFAILPPDRPEGLAAARMPRFMRVTHENGR